MLSTRSTVLALLASLFGALVGCAFIVLMNLLTEYLGPQTHDVWVHVLVMVAIGVVVASLKRWVGDPGDINLLVDNIHVSGGRANSKELRSLIPTSLLCIAGGGAMGPEAPLVQTTAAVGTAFGKHQGVAANHLRVLTISGMATGFALLFGTPIGAAVFALEIMHRRGFEYYEALIPSVIGALIGCLVSATVLDMGLDPIWKVDLISHIQAVDYLWAICGGLCGAGIGALFVMLVRLQKRVFNKIPMFLVPIIGGLGLGLLGVWNPYALTFGEMQLQDLLGGGLTMWALCAAGVAKLLGASLTLSSGWKGGFIIPLFFIGAALGQMLPADMPGLSHTFIFAMAMMIGANASVTKTPIGSALVVSGMCGLPTLAPCLAAGLASLFVSSRLVLFTAQRERSDLGAAE